MKTNLYRPGQAVITTSDESRVVAIINCKVDGDITKQVELAIKEHEAADSVKVESQDVLDGLDPLCFTAEITTDDGDIEVNEYTIEIAATY
ncbi:MAG: hypothetical protein IM631_12525 [Cytophagales bacterium]|nr:hypothetical protein [Cytophagales bacterium]MCA6382340.1 hypothetical protein [Cytophagales bacterium]